MLAQEELSEALWLYGTFAAARNAGKESLLAVPKLKSEGANHRAKYMESFVFGHELAAFWGDCSAYENVRDTEADWPHTWRCC